MNLLGAGLEADRLRGQFDSLAFQSLSSDIRRNSECPQPEQLETNLSWTLKASSERQSVTFDHRLEWSCECPAGFAGVDCSQLQELNCTDERDDDADGLVDCEDDDCCQQPACHDNHLCMQSPEPSRVVGKQPDDHSGDFFSRFQFLIGNKSVQLYANHSSFEPRRVAVLRGKVVKSSGGGLRSVRVDVVEGAQGGFTLSRQDGSFDLLLNGDQYVAVRFLRNAFAPVKRHLFVRANEVNVLEQDVEMWLASKKHNQPVERHNFGSSFQLQAAFELHRLLSTQRHLGERQKAASFKCLSELLLVSPTAQLAPRLVSQRQASGEPEEANFVLATSGALNSRADRGQLKEELEIVYNSAQFPLASSVVKPAVSIELLPDKPNLLSSISAVIVELDVEGQARRERLQPLPGLSYQFAWNRRDVYNRKLYGFSALNVRVGYEFSLNASFESIVEQCRLVDQQLSDLPASWLSKQIFWFHRRIYLEAHQLNQHADIAKWNLRMSNRFQPESETLYLGSGRSLPFRLVYPSVIGESIPVLDSMRVKARNADSQLAPVRLMFKGPHSSIFLIVRGESLQTSRLIQLDASGKRRLLDLNLSALTSKLTEHLQGSQLADFSRHNHNDIQLAYNSYLSTLYLSSKSAARIVQISYSSLVSLNRSQSEEPSEELEIEALCGFGRQVNSNEQIGDCRTARLLSPTSLALDEQRQLLYLIDQQTLKAIDLSSNQFASLTLLASQSGGQFESASIEDCSQANLRLPLSQYQPREMQSLVWSRADSSLYFFDQNILMRVGQDLQLELVAWGSRESQSDLLALLAPSCANSPTELGIISSLTIDDNKHELLIGHRWLTKDSNRAQQSSKVRGKFYLAKLQVGIRSWLGSGNERVVDLHSARSAYDQNIKLLLGADEQLQLNWTQLSQLQLDARSSSGQRNKLSRIPFIHLSGGFERLDSTEINSDGSIFVLDSRDGSIRLLEEYSPRDFNQVERRDVNINRLFAAPSQSTAPLMSEPRKLQVLLLQNPISAELMEFHSNSGLQLSLTSAQGIKWEFYYRILTNSNNNNNIQQSDEDDRSDFQARRLIQQLWQWSGKQQQLNELADAYVRLSSITNSAQNRYQLDRIFTGSSFALRSISLNEQPLAELASDHLGALTSFQPSGKDYWTEIVYDGSTYLLRDQLTKFGESSARKTRRQLSRAVYDRVFFHFCDLFSVNAT